MPKAFIFNPDCLGMEGVGQERELAEEMLELLEQIPLNEVEMSVLPLMIA